MPVTASSAPASSRTASVRVRPVESGSDRRRFIQLPYDLYRDNPYWIAPLRRDVAHLLDPKKNAFFEHGEIVPLLAEDASGEVVGRIAAIRNGMHLDKYDDGVGFFGFFEAVDDEQVAGALFDAVEATLRGWGLGSVRGPANPSMNDTAGLLVDGFDREPSILMPYNPAYYVRLVEGQGFARAMTMWAYYVHKKYANAERLRRGAALVRRRHPSLAIRPLDMKRFDDEVQTVLSIYNDAWSNNWGHVPMTPAELRQLAREMKQIVDPKMVFFVEDDGEPVGFSISLPNLNMALRHVDDGRLFPLGLPKLLAYAQFGAIYEVRMPLMGVRQSHQGRGLDALLVLATVDAGPPNGYDACEMSWVLDSNKVLINALDSLGGVRDKEYAMYEKHLEPG